MENRDHSARMRRRLADGRFEMWPGFLTALAEEVLGERDRLMAHYRNADNMTDRIAALRLLVDLPGEEREEALRDFEARYGNDMLVMDKWFMLQAISRLPDTLARVKALLHHPSFALERPNKVRALIGAFTAANPLHYHALTVQVDFRRRTRTRSDQSAGGGALLAPRTLAPLQPGPAGKDEGRSAADLGRT